MLPVPVPRPRFEMFMQPITNHQSMCLHQVLYCTGTGTGTCGSSGIFGVWCRIVRQTSCGILYKLPESALNSLYRNLYQYQCRCSRTAAGTCARSCGAVEGTGGSMLMCRKSTESGHRPVRRRKRPKEAPLPASPLLKKYIPVASPAANEHGVPPPRSVPAVETCIAKGGGMPSGRIIMQGEEEPATGRSGQQGLGEQGAWGSRTAHLAMAQVLFFWW